MIYYFKTIYVATISSIALCGILFTNQATASISLASGTLLARSSSGPDEALLRIGIPTLVESSGDGESPTGRELSVAQAVLHSLGTGSARFESEISSWTRTNNLGTVTYEFTIDAATSLVVRASSETQREGELANDYYGPRARVANTATVATVGIHEFGRNTTGESTFNLDPGTYKMVLESAGISGGAIDGVTLSQYDFDTLFEWGIGGLAGQSPDTPIFPTLLQPESFEFDVITDDEITFYDPEIATGYRYTSKDVAFASVLVPGALPGGDDLFEVIVGEDSYLLNAGQEFDFTSFYSNGVFDFSILGIDPGEGLDPNDPTAFVTGLSFVEADRRNTFTMSAYSTNPVPEPATLAVWSLLGLCGIGYGMRRRPKRVACNRSHPGE